MKILVACEESQEVTKAFRALGVDAFSCDIAPCSGGHPEWHIQGDVSGIIRDNWDMVIAFPPCTHLAGSGARWFKQKREDGRQQAGIDFFLMFTDIPCPLVAIENPVGIMSGIYRKPDQIIEPWMFGHNASKKTCLWLKGLPKLQPTDIVRVTSRTLGSGKRFSDWQYDVSCLHGDKRRIARSKTFSGIAKAMASQWAPCL